MSSRHKKIENYGGLDRGSVGKGFWTQGNQPDLRPLTKDLLDQAMRRAKGLGKARKIGQPRDLITPYGLVRVPGSLVPELDKIQRALRVESAENIMEPVDLPFLVRTRTREPYPTRVYIQAIPVPDGDAQRFRDVPWWLWRGPSSRRSEHLMVWTYDLIEAALREERGSSA